MEIILYVMNVMLFHHLHSHLLILNLFLLLLGGSDSKGDTCRAGLGVEDPLEKGTATRSSILAQRIPRTEEPGGLVHGISESDTTE